MVLGKSIVPPTEPPTNPPDSESSGGGLAEAGRGVRGGHLAGRLEGHPPGPHRASAEASGGVRKPRGELGVAMLKQEALDEQKARLKKRHFTQWIPGVSTLQVTSIGPFSCQKQEFPWLREVNGTFLAYLRQQQKSLGQLHRYMELD